MLIKNYPELIQKILNLLLVMLQKQKQEESKNLKTLMKKEINCNFISDEEEVDSDNEDIDIRIMNLNKYISKDLEKLYSRMQGDDIDSYSTEKEMRQICDRTINPIKEVDEYEYFKNSVEALSSVNNDLFNSWVNNLTDKTKDDLKNLIHTRRITVTNNKVSTNVPRKLIKIKRDNNINTDNNINN
jgi:hypothetical protein